MRPLDPTAACWIDGRRFSLDQARLAVDDPAVQAGLGLFETLAVRDGKLLELDAHLERMEQAARRLEISVPARERLRATAIQAASESGDCGWLKIVVTGGGRCLAYVGSMDPADEGRNASAVLLPWRRSLRDPLAGLKTLNYAGNWVGLEAARRRGADEGLWLNTRGHLAEGCTSNVFVVGRGKLLTPAAGEGILPGIVRGMVLDLAREMKVPTFEGKVRLARLERAREAFLTSSLKGVRPLVSFEGRPVGNGQPGSLTRTLASELGRRRRDAAAREPSGSVRA